MKSSSILNPLAVKSQAPLDGKTYVQTLAELTDLGTNNNKAFTYYEGMEIYCNENKNKYVWRDIKDAPQGVVGLISPDFTYPLSSTSFGNDYSGRTFNFFEENDLIEITSSDNSIAIENNDVKVNTEGWSLDDDLHNLTSSIEI